MSRDKQVTFFCPSAAIGGTATLFVRLTKFLVRQGYTVRYYDLADGYSDKRLRDLPGVEMRYFDETKLNQIEPLGPVVLYLSNLFGVGRDIAIPPETKLLLWVLHPLNILVSTPLHMAYMKTPPRLIAPLMGGLQPQRLAKLQRFLVESTRHHGLRFMDRECSWFTQLVTNQPLRASEYLPIAVAEDVASEPKRDFGARQPKRIGWLGRLSPDKLASLLSTIADVREHAERTKTHYEMHIIGEGAERARVDAAEMGPYVQRVMHGSLFEGALDEVIRSLDLLVAMGTSVLEGARFGVPAVVPLHRYVPIPPKRFRVQWIEDIRDYDAVIHYERDDVFDMPTLSDVLEAIEDPEAARRHGTAAIEYIRQHHLIGPVAGHLEHAIAESTLTMGDVTATGVLERSVAENLAYKAVPFAKRILVPHWGRVRKLAAEGKA